MTVVAAVEYTGVWLDNGGIRGNRIIVSQVLQMVKKVRGQALSVEKVNLADLENGDLKTSWGLEASHPSADESQIEDLLKTVLIGTRLSGVKGAWDVSNNFNTLLPALEFTQIENFLERVWEGKP
ncbi:hypothetical protein LSUE1_G004734 [Lachnellula suecica]|uniref:Uncharacterized protein n=1 Tax=Lachnellula suecica TaxID=602035 RepID=A0A8T9C8B4_9HELO|nr:hypothetical protein LSUE1_G004734 [Lachnellula suecica]